MVDRFLSCAQNGEDVVLWRALGRVRGGIYVDVGANEPTRDSVSRAFYDRGWSGITVEPLPGCAERHRRERPRDIQVEAVAAATSGGTAVLHEIPGTGLSTTVDAIGERHRRAGHPTRDIEVPARSLDDLLAEHAAGRDVHFLSVDVEGAEAEVLSGLDLRRHRPWVLVVEARAPLSAAREEFNDDFLHEEWEPALVAAGYRFTLNDGVSRFYVAEEHDAELGSSLSYPACVLDAYVSWQQRDVELQLDRARQDAIRWRATALAGWADAMTASGGSTADLRRRAGRLERELDDLRGSSSWRVTAPMRWVRDRQLAARVGG